MAVLAVMCSPDTSAQQTRPLNVWVDTVRFNVCDGVKVFLLAVHTDPILVQDSVVSASMLLSWDISKIDLEDQVITSAETIGIQFDQKKVDKTPDGTMYIQLGSSNLRPVAGSKPLFYVKGIVKAPDTLGGLDGWVYLDPASIHIFGNTEFSPIDSRAGFVRVSRDTTPAYTGKLAVSASSFDTVRLDTVALTIQNLKGRRVKEVSFALKADAGNYEFIDTLQRGTLADTGWSLKSIAITPDSIGARLVASSDLTADGTLLKVIIRRRNDSAFASTLTVTRFGVNRESCLGRLITQEGSIAAAAIPRRDTTNGVEEERARSSAISIVVERERREVMVRGEGIGGRSVEIFDVVGTRLPLESVEPAGASALRVRLGLEPPSGTYFLVLRGRDEIVYKQFTFIK
jgi:hypothetical protein